MKLSNSSVLTVVIPEKATKREIFASEELKKYLVKIFAGIQIETAIDSKIIDGNKILIGGPEHNKLTATYISKTDFDAIVPGPEGMYIKSFGDDTLILAGSSKNVNENERGTLYAVYELLEHYIGCSFAAYVNPEIAGGEYVPVLDSIDLTDIAYIKAAADNTYRTAITEYHGRSHENVLNSYFIDWLAKNRYNRMLLWVRSYEKLKELGLVDEIEKRGLVLTVGHHDAIPTFLPRDGNDFFPEKYYQTHPEYYKLLEDGTRFYSEERWHFGAWCLCSRNKEVHQVLANNVMEWIEQNPTVDTIALWPMDGKRPMCCCEECRKYSDVENYVYAQNEIAKIIGKKYPHIKIDMLAYAGLFNCPDGLQLEPNLFIDEAVTSAELGIRSVGKPDGSCLTGTPYEDNLLKWKKSGASVVYYEYFMGTHSCRHRWMPCADEFQSYWKRFMEVGISGAGTQIEYWNFWNNIFNFYSFARTGYNTELSMEDNLKAFTKIFGEGAPYIAENIRIGEATLDGQVTIKKAGLFLMANIDKETCYANFEKALTAAGTPEARNNIRMMRMMFRYSDVECMYTKLGKDDFYVYVAYEDIEDPDGELYYMSHMYDSSKWNVPGFGCAFPVDNLKQAEFVPDGWYDFEK